MKSEEVIGLTAIAVLLLLLWKHGSETAPASQATLQIPQVTIPRGDFITPTLQVANLPQAQKPTVNINLTSTAPSVTQPAPCMCACGDGASSQIGATVQNFVDNLTQQEQGLFSTYVQNVTNALPPNLDQFLNNPDAANAAKILKAQTAQLSPADAYKITDVKLTGVLPTYSIQNGLLTPDGHYTDKTYPFVRLNNYVPGRQITFGAA